MKSWKKPTPEEVAGATVLLARGNHYRYFFDNLKNPLWIDPLLKKGFFANPTKPVTSNGNTYYPPWPESEFLKRMAKYSESHEAIAPILLTIDDFENPRVVEDLIDIACFLPPRSCLPWIKRLVKWISGKRNISLILPEKLGALISHLAKNKEADAAFQLASVVLGVIREPQAVNVSKKRKDHSYSRPVARFETWYYEEIIKQNVPDLIAIDAQRTFEMFCDLLSRCIEISRTEYKDHKPDDISFIWRPAIEDHEQNSTLNDLPNLLISAIRDIGETIIKSNPSKVSHLVEQLEKKEWFIFRRIALHLLRSQPNGAEKLIEDRLVNKSLFDEACLRHEYMLLAKARFKQLTLESQNTILSWIKNNPDPEKVRTSLSERLGRVATEKEVNCYVNTWKRDRIAPFHDSLPEEWKKQYNEWVKEFGEPEHPEFAAWMSGVDEVGRNPFTNEELAAKPIEELIQVLRTWRPPTSTDFFRPPSYDGFATQLHSIISASPEHFASNAELFQSVDPTYVRALFHGLRDALKQKKSFSWDSVLKLCLWVVEQPKQIEGRSLESDEDNRDMDWGATRRALADLISDGLLSEPLEIPFQYREVVWKIIEPLTRDDDPTPEDDSKEDRRDAATYSYNSIRGEAMHCVIRYALWVSRSFEVQPNGKELIDQGLNAIPEVKSVLEKHLDIKFETSIGIRAVYGLYLPWLVRLDANWVQTNLSRIFPRDSSQLHLREAAWNAYVSSRSPWDTAYQMLSEEYRFGVEKICDYDSNNPHQKHYKEALASHLMILCWRGQLKLDDPNLKLFFTTAPLEFREHAIEFIGRSLYNTKGRVPSHLLERLRQLWEQRLQAIKELNTDFSELLGFGWWFVSEKFDQKWALEQLREVIKLTGDIEPDSFILDSLNRLSDMFPELCMECLFLLKENPKRRIWYYSEGHLRKILNAATRSQDLETQNRAAELINRLGERGIFLYKDLLPTT